MGRKLNITPLREEKGWTQTYLALLMNVSRSSVCQWESGGKVPSTWKLQRLAELFGCTIDELFTPA